ncbi:DEAD/DEAH box helicase [Parvibium lacunae]|uniref:ATP-dependent helicase n=1 Tax=Parvibium lacunae TaxID=1888893 RepID=A0A368L7U6_9BURK|nr:DEAD/DEAH box helicase [Parvibium lacunae]RCS59684.1 ATP-dependent helicase [Parvibium lacunae]
MSFDSLGLHPALVNAVKRAGYTDPTSVQAAAIPLALAGKDLQVSAATGSGKTAAFMLPALHRLTETNPIKSKGPRVLVLTPTRELAQQVTKACTTYGGALPRLRVASILGGMPYGAQLKTLKEFVDVMVATPGRLLDHMERGSVDFSRLELLVLDEADRMLDMGFQEDIEKVVAALPANRQTMLFSATFDGAIAGMIQRILRNPQKLEIATQRDQHTNIAQHMHYVDNLNHKEALLDHWLRDVTVDQAIVFTGTKREADRLSRILDEQGHASAALHGDMQQNARTRTLNKLRRGQIRVLVATDVAARGIDVPSITHVINFDLPMQAEDYVHRIGRTGRAGKNGIAITLVSPQERFKLKQIERFTTHKIPVQTVAGLESKYVERPEKEFKGNGRPNDRKFGERKFGDRKFGDRKPAERSFGERKFGDRKPTEQRFGDKPFGDRNFGDKPQFNARGDRPARTEGTPFQKREGGPAQGARQGEPRRFSNPNGGQGERSERSFRSRSDGQGRGRSSGRAGYSNW